MFYLHIILLMHFLPAVQQILFHNMAKCYKEAVSLGYLCLAHPDFPYGFTDVDFNPALYFPWDSFFISKSDPQDKKYSCLKTFYILLMCTRHTHTHLNVVVVVIQSLSRVQLFVTPWTAAHQASLSFSVSSICSNSCPFSRWYHPTKRRVKKLA